MVDIHPVRCYYYKT